jgi:hypothetical protein
MSALFNYYEYDEYGRSFTDEFIAYIRKEWKIDENMSKNDFTDEYREDILEYLYELPS